MLSADQAMGTHPEASEPDATVLRNVVERRTRRANAFIDDQAECDEEESDDDDEEDVSILRDFFDDDTSQDSVDFYARIDRVLDEVHTVN